MAMMVECELMKAWMIRWTDSLIEEKDYLNELDTPIGDDDHGTNMERGAKAVKKVLLENIQDTQELTKKIAMELLTKVGGASGIIYGTAFLEMSKETILTNMIDRGIQGIEKRGKAELGDKTLYDVWVPVLQLIKENNLTDESIETIVDDTKPLLAKKGRAEFVGEKSIGHLDPGAVSSGLLFKALLKEID